VKGVPSAHEVVKQALLMLAAAALAAWIAGNLPEYKNWVKKQWE
jgi:hypothetical protein